jgi:hypothetical protein
VTYGHAGVSQTQVQRLPVRTTTLFFHFSFQPFSHKTFRTKPFSKAQYKGKIASKSPVRSGTCPVGKEGTAETGTRTSAVLHLFKPSSSSSLSLSPSFFLLHRTTLTHTNPHTYFSCVVRSLRHNKNFFRTHLQAPDPYVVQWLPSPPSLVPWRTSSSARFATCGSRPATF